MVCNFSVLVNGMSKTGFCAILVRFMKLHHFCRQSNRALVIAINLLLSVNRHRDRNEISQILWEDCIAYTTSQITSILSNWKVRWLFYVHGILGGGYYLIYQPYNYLYSDSSRYGGMWWISNWKAPHLTNWFWLWFIISTIEWFIVWKKIDLKTAWENIAVSVSHFKMHIHKYKVIKFISRLFELRNEWKQWNGQKKCMPTPIDVPVPVMCWPNERHGPAAPRRCEQSVSVALQ